MTRLFFFLLLVFSLFRCAQITPLEGGEKDITPPQLDTLHSSPLGATHYHPKEIKLSFNEWVRLNNVFKNVLVSPPLAKRPKITLKRKTVVFEFDKDEVLKDNTTYSINFGSAIVDLTEANPAKGLTYVFSTGDAIDSLTVTGKVVDAYTHKPVENVNVMLYASDGDSVVYQEKPYYLGISDKTGQFAIHHVRAGQYKAFALKDQDFNYLFSQPDEPIGFLSKRLTVSDTTPPLTFRLSPERLPLKLKGVKNIANGVKLLEFNRTPLAPDFQPEHVQAFKYLEKGDSIKIWYSGVDTTSKLIILSEKKAVDTISLRPKSRLPSIRSIHCQALAGKKGTLSAMPNHPVSIEFNLPVKSWNDSLIILSKDSLTDKLPTTIQISPKNPKVLQIGFPWQEKSTYRLTIFPKGIRALNDHFLEDTLAQKITPISKEDLGNIQLTIQPPDSTKQYVLRLLTKGQEKQMEILPKGKKQVVEWKLLPPGDYSLELIEDDNQNGVWDPGNYLHAQQPERIFVKSLDKLRANWDLEVIWTPTKMGQAPEKKS